MTSVDLATRAPSAGGAHATTALNTSAADAHDPMSFREILITLPSDADREG